jgi:hypothetical protein
VRQRGTVRPADYIFFIEKKLISSNRTRMFAHHRELREYRGC